MRPSVILTHSQKPLPSWYSTLAGDYDFIWVPLLKLAYRDSANNLSSLHKVIVSSPTSLYWFFHFSGIRDFSSHTFYLIGKNTELYFQSLMSSDLSINYLMPQISTSSSPSMSYLLSEFQEDFDSTGASVLWLGSAAGVKKHSKKLLALRSIVPLVTHYNWPRYNFDSQESHALYQADFITISSHSAALAFHALSFEGFLKKDLTCLLSDRRLFPYFSDLDIKLQFGPWVPNLKSLLNCH